MNTAEAQTQEPSAAPTTAGRRVIVCAGTGCMANGSLKAFEALKREMPAAGLNAVLEFRPEPAGDGIRVSESGCQGFCQIGPLVTILPEGIFYTKVKAEDVNEIVACTLVGGQVIDRLLYLDPQTRKRCHGTADIPFYQRQSRMVLKECGLIDPEDITEFIAHGGYEPARKAYLEMDSPAICDLILKSGLRGRGGGGFPTGRKWEAARVQNSTKKYVICNGDEGDPGAFMDRSVMEGNPHSVLEGLMIAARAIGLTVIEEGNEFLARKKAGQRLPQFTSCCPGWVKFAEQYYPELLSKLSTCRSPQQMFGSLVKEMLSERLGIAREDLVVVSIMPCTAKKFEAQRPEFKKNGVQDVDNVLTTQELAQMIEAAGMRFRNLQPESLDMPFGFTTGAGVLFGDSGGVTEAVLRFAVEKITGTPLRDVDFETVRGESGLREANLTVDGQVLKLAIVHGLANARVVAEKVKAGNADYDLIEVMACPGGCIGGAGQPVSHNPEVNSQRTRGLYKADKGLQLHKSQDNVFVSECYTKFLGEVGGEKAHHLLHTEYQSRRRIADESMSLLGRPSQGKIRVDVCLGTNCYLKGSQAILNKLMDHVNEEGLENAVDIRASFCFENCEHGPTVKVGATRIDQCTVERAFAALDHELQRSVDGGAPCANCTGNACPSTTPEAWL